MPFHVDELSSPDPLQDSVTYSSPAKTRYTTRTRRSLPLEGSSPRKQTFELDVGNSISPQKIRVTVEAEHSDRENDPRLYGMRNSASPTPYRAPTIRRKEKTTTTTIPLKGLSDSEDDASPSPTQTPKRGRGRPRKSTGTPVPAKNWNVTPGANPSPRRRRTLGSLVDGDDDDDWDFAIGAGVEVGRGKGRSRSRSVKSTSRKTRTPATQTDQPSDKLNSSATSRKGKGRRKTLTPGEVFILEDQQEAGMEEQDIDPMDNSAGRALAPVAGNSAPQSLEAQSNPPPKSDDCDISLSKFTPARKSPRKPAQYSYRGVSESPERSTGRNPSQVLHLGPIPPNDTGAAMRHAEDGVNDYRSEEQNDGGDMLGDLPEFDTILESEGFSMISVESVPSLREHLSSPAGEFPSNEKNTATLINKNISSLSQAANTVVDDSFSSVAPDILEAATPRRKHTSSNHVVIQSANTHTDTNYSTGVPTEFFRPVTPGWVPQNGNLISLKISDRNAGEDSFSSIPPEVLEAATPARHAQKTILQSLKVQDSRANEDSFSSIPTDVLDAATPGKPKQITNLLSVKALTGKALDESFSSVQSTAVEAPVPAINALVDSGLSVPHSQRENEPPYEDSKLGIPETIAGISSSMRRATSRLLTPEETPSPPQELEQERTQASSQGSKKKTSKNSVDVSLASEGSSLIYSQMRSSPPSAMPQRLTYSTHTRHHQFFHPTAAQTPSIVFSSPSLPPLIQQQPVLRKNHALQNSRTGNSQESNILPSLRAGKALQDLAVPSPNRNRAQSLGSPFKSPVSRRSSSVASCAVLSSDLMKDNAQNTQQNLSKTADNIFGGFSDDTRRELRKSLMMGEELARSQDSIQVHKWSSNTASREEDPFSNTRQLGRSSSPEDMHGYTLGLPSRTSMQGTQRPPSSAQSYDAMSWQPEMKTLVKTPSNDASRPSQNEVPSRKEQHDAPRTSELYNGVSDMWKDDREEQWARERAAVIQQIESASTSQVIVLSSDGPETTASLSGDSDDEDIWQAEARHSSSLLDNQPSREPLRPSQAEKPRRSKIPSPWRQNSKRLVYSDEFSQASPDPKVGKDVIFPSQLLSRPESKPVRHEAPWNELRIEKRNTLFSGSQPTSLANASEATVQRVKVPSGTISDAEDLSLFDTSVIHKTPQKSFIPRPREKLDLSALLASSPLKAQYDESSFIDTPAAIRSQLLGDMHDSFHSPTPRSASSTYQNSFAVSSPPFENFDSASQEQSSIDGGIISSTESGSSSGPEFESSLQSEGVSQDTSTDSSALHYPAPPGPLSPNRSATPSKSCLRTPSTTSPLKSVAWQSPTLSPPPLSGTEWSKKHWLLLEALWKDYEELGPGYFGNGEAGRTSKYVGQTAYADDEKLTMEPWHLDVVAAFIEEVPGWDEGKICIRLFSLIVGAKQRKEAKDKADAEAKRKVEAV